MSDQTVVIVEDDALIALYLKGLCESFGARVLGQAADGEAALKVVKDANPSHVLMDMRLRGPMDGVDVGAKLNNINPDVKVVYVTGSNEPETRARIQEDHPHRILIKPINPSDLEEALAP